MIKNLNSFSKKIIFIFTCLITMFILNINVEAVNVTQQISLAASCEKAADGIQYGNLLRNFTVLHLTGDENEKVFCTESNKLLPQTSVPVYTLTNYYPEVDGSIMINGVNRAGVIYIIKNGYNSSKNLSTGYGLSQNNLLYFQTQMAIWLYYNQTITNNTGTADEIVVTEAIKEQPIIIKDESEINNLQKFVGKATSYKAITGTSSVSVTISGDNIMQLYDESGVATSNFKSFDNLKYMSGNMKINSSASGNISLSLTGPTGSYIINENGEKVSSISSGSKIRIVVPYSSVSMNSNAQIKLTASTTSNSTREVIHLYTPADSNYQSVLTYGTESIPVNSQEESTFTIRKTSKVKISKKDATGKKELPGALLQLEDEEGNIIKSCYNKDTNTNDAECKWTSGETSYEIENLPVGTYYLKETLAPKGYVLSEERVSFKIDNNSYLVEVEMKNDLEVEVPNTLSSRSALLLTIAMIDVALGFGMLLYVKKNKVEE